MIPMNNSINFPVHNFREYHDGSFESYLKKILIIVRNNKEIYPNFYGELIGLFQENIYSYLGLNSLEFLQIEDYNIEYDKDEFYCSFAIRFEDGDEVFLLIPWDTEIYSLYPKIIYEKIRNNENRRKIRLIFREFILTLCIKLYSTPISTKLRDEVIKIYNSVVQIKVPEFPPSFVDKIPFSEN